MSNSIRRTDLLALSNLRDDGRKPSELRRVRVQLGPLDSGSALVQMGLTTAIATCRGPIECQRRGDELPDRAVLSVTVKMAPFSGAERRVRNSKSDRRLIEMAHMVKQAMEATLLLSLFPKSSIEIVICVLADDGGLVCAAINAASLAVLDAGIPMKDLLCACSAGYATDMETTLVDLNRREESSFAGQPAVYLPVAILPQRGTVVLAQCEARLPSFETFERVLDAAMESCQAVFQIMQAATREHASVHLASMNGRASIEFVHT
jgi:exosome complex component RRP41